MKFTDEEKKAITEWADTDEGRAEIKHILEVAFNDAKHYRALTKVPRSILEKPYDI